MDTHERRTQGQTAAPEGDLGVVTIAEALGDLSPESLDNLCKRMTGWSLKEWDEMHRRQRSEDLRKGRIKAGIPMTHDRMIEMMSMYGFDADDFYCKLTAVGIVKAHELSYVAPNHEGRVAEHVIRWYLKPDRIQ